MSTPVDPRRRVGRIDDFRRLPLDELFAQMEVCLETWISASTIRKVVVVAPAADSPSDEVTERGDHGHWT